jgi:hypothetical protein
MFVAALGIYYHPVQRHTFAELHYCGKNPEWNDDTPRSDIRCPDPLTDATGVSNLWAFSNYSAPFDARRYRADVVLYRFHFIFLGRMLRAPSLIMSHVPSSISSGIDATHSSAFWIALLSSMAMISICL